MLAHTTPALAALLYFAPIASAAWVADSFLETLRSPRPFHAQSSPERNKTCVAESYNDPKIDDAKNILQAIHDCNSGGHVIFAERQKYTIASPMNLTGLTAMDLDIQGTLSFPSTNLTYWQNASFDLKYQNATSFFILGGHDINVYGSGTIQGNGQAWWDAFVKDKALKRPVLFAIVGLEKGSVSGISMRNSPLWHNVIVNSSDVVYSGLQLRSTSSNGNFEKNTDGWDVYRSERVTIENSTVTNGDDCVSLKPNSTSILVQNLICNGTHGISVGSLGQYVSQTDYVEDVLVRNISMFNSSEGARIKVWSDSYSEKSATLTGGGGRGLVKNVTYDGMFLDNVDYGLTITQCYGQDDEEKCFRHPYCSKSCQKAHWVEHKKDCKSPYMKSTWSPAWYMEKRTPTFIGNGPPVVSFGGAKYLWGNMPAIDVLALGQNEGPDHANDLNLLFAASGDFRNVIKTVAEVPDAYNKALTLTLNDRDLDIVARNTIMLILLLAVEDTATAVDCVLHVWYSAQIEKSHMELLNSAVRPLIEDMCHKIAEKSENILLAKTWSWGTKSIRLVLSKKAWEATLSYFSLPTALTSQRAHDLRTAITLAPQRKDHVDRHLFSQTPTQRLCFMKYRRDGILLPFGSSRQSYNVPNPTFFQTADVWPLKDSADPADGWETKDVMAAPMGDLLNDAYGKLYFYVKDVLTSFRRRIQTMKISFNLYQEDAKSLTDYLSPGTFSRIEVSNICDRTYLGLAATISYFSPLLETPAVNPHATLITLFMNALEEEFMNSGDERNKDVMTKELKLICEYAGKPSKITANDPSFLQLSFSKSLVRDKEKYLEKYMDASQAALVMQMTGSRLRSPNKIVKKWPAALKLGPKQAGAKEEFNAAMASKLSGMECYLEWQRVDKTF
ncbi:extracellular exo-polygalacturonase [Venturia nashicola]|nr:extracellular exo-polygalacturonase [Venturia nashicola]